MLLKRTTFLTAMGLWRERAERLQFSPKTIRNTETFFRMLSKFVSPGMRLSKFSAEKYERTLDGVRRSGYAVETVHDLDATLGKLIRLAERKGLTRRRIPLVAERVRTTPEVRAKVIPRSDFEWIIDWLKTHEYRRNGENIYSKYRLLFTLLYYTGMRIGEALALTAEDFWFDGEVWRVKVSKSYLYDFKLTKSTKNGKIREIPLTEEVNEARSEIATATEQIFDFSPQAAREMLHKICDEAGLPRYRLHDFRHTFVSNLMRENVPLAVVAEVSGDIQATLLKRYSHMFPSDERLVLDALTCASGHAAKPTRHPKTERLFPAISRDD